MSFNLKEFFNTLCSKNNKDDIICNKHRKKKLFFTGHEQLTISASTNTTAEKVTKMAYNIMQKYQNNPISILRYIEAKGTKVAIVPKLLPLIKFLGYEEGFIPKHNSWKAYILNIAINKALKEKITFSQEMPDMFLFCRKDLSLYFLGYQFHHWLSYQYNLPGYDYETMSLYKSTMGINANLGVLSINQLISIKDMIDRDKQALDFVTKFVREQVGAKERLNSMLKGKTVKI